MTSGAPSRISCSGGAERRASHTEWYGRCKLATMSEQESLTEQAARHIGVSVEQAQHIVEAVCDALGELFSEDEAIAVAAHLPKPLADLMLTGAGRSVTGEGVEELVGGVAWRENVPRALALEHVTAVCDALTTRLPSHVRAKLRADLPQALAQLFAGEGGAPVPGRRRARLTPTARETLAGGQPGSKHPLSTSATSPGAPTSKD
jgi:uncharacterized protein (DUF2267 family)